MSTRPCLHFTPQEGFMNDPNGLVQSNGLWHLFYQWNPTGMEAGNQHWGHAISRNLYNWNHLPVALYPNEDGGLMFSGSAVIDKDNTSGFFKDSHGRIPTNTDGRIVLIYTTHYDDRETQNIAYSQDGGITFIKYENNPIIDLNESQFRDPKVFWHEDTKHWVMVVALAQKFRIAIFRSSNLKNWEKVSEFGPAGILGSQYECPDLFRLPIENTEDHRWVLVVSVNPGSPINGGSITQYFIGEFDGITFTPIDKTARIFDHGNDFYASQTFSNVLNNQVISMGWASNWSYANKVPAEKYRGMLTCPRELSLRSMPLNPEAQELVLVQRPCNTEALKHPLSEPYPLELQNVAEFPPTFMCGSRFYLCATIPLSAAESEKLEFLRLRWSATSDVLNSKQYVELGYRFSDGAVYIDRGSCETSWKDPMYSERSVSNLPPIVIDDKLMVDLGILMDHSIVEVYGNHGGKVFTNTYRFSEEVEGSPLKYYYLELPQAAKMVKANVLPLFTKIPK
ncbi:beta-fructofuranosidase-like protein [Schizosaccharomyces octosporus yFS286]|uniref:Beta-fructofuranosidase n=1 Tax=Schizosaccharomyces octosporus (strain yFS286) TaxID=483514 RepID=S9R120_SCHOY|nr:beta-fructofuranosidase-like protein [Schizosaccharomyces octosporus yFS286]EPX72125.1 beta-fructofuranosidase-like protein [Schizosaccharomyces octosporus yFS286]